MSDIFISHSSNDNDAASEIAEILRVAGFGSLFLDLDPESGIGAGAEWERTLYAKLRQCHAVVVVLSPAWIASKWCFAEAVQAREKGKTLFPVIMRDCDLPSILAEVSRFPRCTARGPGDGRTAADGRRDPALGFSRHVPNPSGYQRNDRGG